MSILVNTGPTTLTKTWYVDGDATDVGTITIGINDGTGTVVVASGTVVTDNSDGTYEYSLTRDLIPNPTILVTTWTEASAQSQTDHLEVVGGWLFTEAAARAFDSSAMTNATTYPDAVIAADRVRITDLLETWTHRSWVPRYARVELAGNGTRRIAVKGGVRLSDGTRYTRSGYQHDLNSVLSVTANGSAVSTSNVVIDGSELVRTDTTWPTATTSNPLNVVVEYTYGLPPGAQGSDRIGLLLARDRIVSSNISDRASSFSDELGTYRFTTPGIGRAVSTLPEVNQWVKDNSMMVPVV